MCRSALPVVSQVEVANRGHGVKLARVGGVTGQAVPAYTRVDLRLGWQTGPFGVSVGARNLLDDRHAEWGPSIVGQLSTEVERDFYVRAFWHF